MALTQQVEARVLPNQLFTNLHRVICASVIHHQHLKLLIGLMLDPAEAFFNGRCPIVHRNNHTDQRCAHSSHFPNT